MLRGVCVWREDVTVETRIEVDVFVIGALVASCDLALCRKPTALDYVCVCLWGWGGGGLPSTHSSKALLTTREQHRSCLSLQTSFPRCFSLITVSVSEAAL